MKWTTKALIQRVLSKIPGGSLFYYLGQRYFYGFRKLHIDSKIDQGNFILKNLSEVGGTVEGKITVEIGTGWVPVIPLLFWLFGSDKCFTFDIERLLKDSLVIESVKQLLAIASNPNEKLNEIYLTTIKSDRLKILQQLIGKNSEQVLLKCNIAYFAPKDASFSELPSNSIDLVYSNVVLEMSRILHPGGYMVHHIDLSDHFSHSDPSISLINFLQFSELAFSKYNSNFLYQNRLRVSAYRNLIIQSGFSIVHEERYISKKALQSFPSLHIHPDFSGYKPEELCTTNYCVVAKRD
jgi:hypothetical protein